MVGLEERGNFDWKKMFSVCWDRLVDSESVTFGSHTICQGAPKHPSTSLVVDTHWQTALSQQTHKQHSNLSISLQLQTLVLSVFGCQQSRANLFHLFLRSWFTVQQRACLFTWSCFFKCGFLVLLIISSSVEGLAELCLPFPTLVV